MKILLVAVDAKYIHSNLAIYNLQAYAKEYREIVSRKEFTINQQEEMILAELFHEQAQVVCFSCYIWNIDRILRVAEALHLVMPETELWLGGPEVSFNPEEILEKYSFIKGVMSGEGEETFRRLCGYYAGLFIWI